MKPTFTKSQNSKRHVDEVRNARAHFGFPKTDCDYHTTTFDLNSRCPGKRRGSFREISASYFQREARQSFVTEAVYFSLIIVTTAAALVSGAHAWLNLLRAIGRL
jgi:hypothetical protein